MKQVVGLASILAVLAMSKSAAALRPFEQQIETASSRTEVASPPRVPAPFVLPELAHRGLDFGVDWYAGRFASQPGLERSTVNAGMVRASMEANIVVPRRMFIGGSFPIGFGMPPDGGLASGEAARPAGMRRFTGNLEAHIRTVFPLPTWLEIGFVMGLVFPTAVFDRDYRPNISAARLVGSLDPSNYVDFLPGRFGFRPAGDLRIRRGKLNVQLRHGIDVMLDEQGLSQTQVMGRLIAHVGYLSRPELELSVEGSQFYFFSSEDPPTSGTPSERAFAQIYRQKDGSRSAITLGPALRAMTEFYDYGVAIVTNLADPLSPAASGFLGIRFSIIGHVEKK